MACCQQSASPSSSSSLTSLSLNTLYTLTLNLTLPSTPYTTPHIQELYYRHLYARAQPSLRARCESWDNYCDLFGVILHGGCGGEGRGGGF